MLLGLAFRVMDRRGATFGLGRAGRPDRVEGEAVVALGLILWASASLAIPSLLGPVKVVSDGPIYHLYFAARWWKAGRLFLVASPFGENAATYFPAVGDLWFTWLLAAWGGDRLAKVGQAPFLLVCALAAYGLARRLGAGRSSALIATAWFVASSPFLLFSFEPNVDTIFVAGYLLAAYFFLQYALGDGGTGIARPRGPGRGRSLGDARPPGSSSCRSCSPSPSWPRSDARPRVANGPSRRPVTHPARGHGGLLVRPQCAPDRQPALSPPPRGAWDGSGWRVGTAPT